MITEIIIAIVSLILIFYYFGRGIGIRGIWSWYREEMHRFFVPKVIYLDHNATTPLLPEVKAEMRSVLEKSFGNASSLHTHGRMSRGIIEKSRKIIASSLNCEPFQIIFTSGGTEANNTVIKGVFLSSKRDVKHIITTKIEHESIQGACEQVESMGGLVTYIGTDRNGRVSVEDVRNAISEDTILISVMHANNETGIIQPVNEISKLAKTFGIPFHTDSVQTFGKIPLNVQEIGCEFLTVSAHKINGPKGCGALYYKGNCPFNPLIFGGQQEREFRAGTEPHHQLAGFGKAVEMRCIPDKQRKELIRQSKLREFFVKKMGKVESTMKINQAKDGRNQLPGTLNLTFPGEDGIRLLAGLDCYEISVSIGSACTAEKIEPSHVLLGMGLSEKDALSSIRISMGNTTTRSDIERVVNVLDVIIHGTTPGFEFLDPHLLTEEEIRSHDNFLIDVRFPVERAISPSIPGAKEWSHIGFDQHFKEIPSDKRVIIMCRTGVMSFSAAYRLAKLGGHRNVRVIFGGYQAWLSLHLGLIEKMK